MELNVVKILKIAEHIVETCRNYNDEWKMIIYPIIDMHFMWSTNLIFETTNTNLAKQACTCDFKVKDVENVLDIC